VICPDPQWEDFGRVERAVSDMLRVTQVLYDGIYRRVRQA